MRLSVIGVMGGVESGDVLGLDARLVAALVLVDVAGLVSGVLNGLFDEFSSAFSSAVCIACRLLRGVSWVCEGAVTASLCFAGSC